MIVIMAKEKILRVTRTKEQAKRTYDKISIIYDFIEESFERKFRNNALEKLDIKKGENVLEVGFGTGHSLMEIAEKVGKNGKAYGIDISSGMIDITKNRLKKKGLIERVELYCGDAICTPNNKSMFDAVFMSFVLELFDTPEIPVILKEIKRIIKPNGRLGVVSLSKENGNSGMLKAYEWIHEYFPKIADCRPIYVEQSIRNAGYQISYKENIKIFGLPGEIVIAIFSDSQSPS
jgi:demethylmenaquinone methyltransferase/2-methoxy-6-polyprenyl-1,4-benzoquinol methylase